MTSAWQQVITCGFLIISTEGSLALITDTQLLCGLSTTALAAEEIRSICGFVLNEAITAYMTADPNTPALGSPREWKNYRRKRQLAAAVEAAVTRTVGDSRIASDSGWDGLRW